MFKSAYHDQEITACEESLPATPMPTSAAATATTSSSFLLSKSDAYETGMYELGESPSSRTSLKQEIREELTCPPVDGWPQHAQPLKGFRHRVRHASLDLLLAAIALIFLVFSGLVYQANGTIIGTEDHRLFAAARIGTTLFPYLFAAIVGRTLAAAAQWRLEAGARLMTIDQLCTSTTIFNTLKAINRLGVFTILSISLAGLWCLSPVGSQATQRVASIRTRNESSTMPLSWVDTTTPYIWGTTQYLPILNSVSAIQSSAMMAPVSILNSAVDQWGNLKIPLLENLDTRNMSTSGWVDIPQDPVFTSLVGIPISDKNYPGPSSFILNATYWHASCSNISRIQEIYYYSAAGLTNYTNSSLTSFVGSSELWQIAINKTALNNTLSGPATFVFEIIGVSATNSSASLRNHFSCALTTSVVEMGASCGSPSMCQIDSMRYSPSHVSDTFNLPYLLFGDNRIAPRINALSSFLWSFAGAFPVTHEGTAHPNAMEQYLMDSTKNPFAAMAGYIAVDNLTSTALGTGLTQLLNTRWLISIAPISTVNVLDPSSEPWNSGRTLQLNNATRTVYTKVTYLHCDTTWLALLILSSSVLFLLSLAAGILRLFLKGPETLDIVSTLTRPNTLKVPANGSFIGGEERSRMLRNMRIRLGTAWDVDYPGRSERIVVGNEEEVRALGKGGLYH